MLSIENADVLGNFASSGGGGVIPTNSVIVDPNAEEVADKVFNSYTDARAYVLTQTPSETNRWTIFCYGEIVQDVYLDPYINIVGNYKNTIINVVYSNISALSDYGNSVIRGCEIQDIWEDTSNNIFIFEECTLKSPGSTPLVDGTLYFKRCHMVEGDLGAFNTPFAVVLEECTFGTDRGVTFPDNDSIIFEAYDCNFIGGVYTLTGGYFERCRLALTDYGWIGGAYVLAGTYTAKDCLISSANGDEDAYIFNFDHCYGNTTVVNSSASLTAGSVITTKNCTDITVANADDVNVVWNNYGALLKDGSGTRTEMQDGIDRFPVFTDDVSNPPTDAELDSAIGTPADKGAGYKAIVDDNGAGANVYLVVSDGTNWWHQALTKSI
jgi:hypothetical protein